MLKGWRTVLVNMLSTIIPVLALTEWRGVLPEDWLPFYALGLAIINLSLRAVTTTPVGKNQ